MPIFRRHLAVSICRLEPDQASIGTLRIATRSVSEEERSFRADAADCDDWLLAAGIEVRRSQLAPGPNVLTGPQVTVQTILAIQAEPEQSLEFIFS